MHNDDKCMYLQAPKFKHYHVERSFSTSEMVLDEQLALSTGSTNKVRLQLVIALMDQKTDCKSSDSSAILRSGQS